MPRVGLGHGQKIGLLPLLRRGEAHLGAMSRIELAREPLPHDLCVLGQRANDHLARDGGGGVVVAHEEVAQQILVGHVGAAVQDELVGIHDAALADDEHVHPGHGLLAEEPDDVGGQVAGGHGVLLVGKRVDGVDARLQPSRPLEVELGGGLLHFRRQLVDELAVVAGEEALDAPHVLGVLLGRNGPATGAGAEAHVAVETGTRIALQESERVLLQRARESPPVGAGGGAQGYHAPGDVDHLPGGAGVGERTEVLRVGLVFLAGVLDGREHIAFGERDEGVALVVFEVRVEKRAVLVDEVLLQHERLVLVVDDEVVEGVDGLHEQGNLCAIVLEVHVLAHARPQLLGLADVDDLAGGVFPQVHAGLGGHRLQLALDARELLLLGLAGAAGLDATAFAHGFRDGCLVDRSHGGRVVDDVHGGRLAFAVRPDCLRDGLVNSVARGFMIAHGAGERRPHAALALQLVGVFVFPGNSFFTHGCSIPAGPSPCLLGQFFTHVFAKKFELLASKGSLTAFLGRHWRNSPHQLFA